MAAKKNVNTPYVLVVAECNNNPEVVFDIGGGIMNDIEEYASDNGISPTEVGVYELGVMKKLTLSFQEGK